MANDSNHPPGAAQAADGSHEETPQPVKAKSAIWRRTDSSGQVQEVPLAELVNVLGDMRPHLEAVLPTLSPAAFARINAARERCDKLIAEARTERDKLLAAPASAAASGDWLQARTLRQRAFDGFKTAQSAAAVTLLDAQAQEFLPLTGDRFSYETLPVLAATSLALYGKGEPGYETEAPLVVENAVENAMREWRARCWERQAAAEGIKPGTPTSAVDSDSPPAPKKRGRRAKFTEEQFRQARDAKNAAKSNKKIAMILYRTKTPTPEQQRGVSMILKRRFPDLYPPQKHPGLI
jgi:hypothetical protein